MWSAGPSLPNPRDFFCSSAVGNKIYVLGGNLNGYPVYTVSIFNTETNTWSTGSAASTSFNRPASVAVGSKIYMFGASSRMDIYDAETDTWSVGIPAPSARSLMSLAAIGDKIFTIGGDKGGATNILEIYDTVKNTWLTGSSLNIGRVYATSAIINGNAKVDLSWGAVSGATSYTVKRATTAGEPYTVIAENVTGTTYTDTSVTNGTTYYYVVTAVNAAGSSSNSNEASATPKAGSGGGEVGSKALLVITMTNGLEKEYELSAAEINAFINWYDSKAAGSGAGYFKINKTFNLGPFLNRTDYLTFDKIQNSK